MCKQFMLGVCRPLQDGGSYPLVFAIVDALQRGHWSPNDFLGGAVFTTVALALLYHMVMQLVKMLSTMQL